mmetsp:Transcript_65803/g.106681  ORF Transcript_65803/g.106681 Transcript_65803/m.106681 type:complete len:119 (+) Transcript_65803:190-546(+)
MILLEAPTRALLFHYKDIKKEIVHTLLLEEYGVSKKWVIIMDRRQDINPTSTPAGKSGPSAQDRYRAAAWSCACQSWVLLPWDHQLSAVPMVPAGPLAEPMLHHWPEATVCIPSAFSS